MSFYPPVPISFVPSGDKVAAARLYQEGRRRAGQLYNDLSGGYGNPHFDDIDERLFSGRSGPFYYLTEEGYFVTINVKIDGICTYVYVDAVPRAKVEEKTPCRCCRDCITIGEVVEKIYPFGSTQPPKYVVDICFQAPGGDAGKLRLIDGAYAADGNPDFQPGDRYIVVATPALWNPDPEPPATTNHIPVTTNLKTWQGTVDITGVDTFNFRPPRIWQVFNCMILSDVFTAGADLKPVGLDNSLYTEGGEACMRGGDAVILEDPATSTSNPIPSLSLRFILTSMRAGECLDMTE